MSIYSIFAEKRHVKNLLHPFSGVGPDGGSALNGAAGAASPPNSTLEGTRSQPMPTQPLIGCLEQCSPIQSVSPPSSSPPPSSRSCGTSVVSAIASPSPAPSILPGVTLLSV
uniref:Uncharacterized protein n=1 Tax=Parascaris univalens TaxID=6257 RepID=A0A915CJ84_PARUN